MDLISRAAPRAAPALFDPVQRRWLAYGELREEVDRMSAAIGGPRKQLAAVWTTGALPEVVGYLAALQSGLAVLPIDPQMPPEWQRRILDLYQPEWVIGAGADGVLTDGYEPRTDAPVRRRLAPPGAEIHADIALLLSTSGSTGSPRQVVLSARNVLSNARAIAEALALTPADRAIATLPLHYSYGLSVLHSHLLAGGSLVLNPFGLVQRQFWDLCEAAGANTMPGVPATYAMLKRVAQLLERSSIHTLTQAGGRLPAEDARLWHERMAARGGRLFVMYGQTEATARMAVLDPAALPSRPASAGRAIPGGHLSIDPASGEILYEGPNVMMGYAAARADLASGDRQHGRLRTGDLGELDAGGYLTVTGRIARIAKVDGRRMSLDEIELLLGGDAPIAALAVGGGLLIVYDGPHDTVQDAALRERAVRLLRLRPADVRVIAVGALPRVTNGKIDYVELQRSIS